MKKLALTLLVLAPVALSGCQTIRAHNPFRHKEPAYRAAQQEQPLEVPPGMDQPPTSDALAIPSAGSPAATPAGAAAQPAPTAQSAGTATNGTETPPAATIAPVAAAPGTGMTLSDTPQSAYRRVGLALARGDVGQVTAHDDTALTYDVAVDTVVKEEPAGGFLHRMFHHAKSETVKGAVTVTVTPSGTGSLIEASGDANAAARVMAVLQQRLK